jgi:hypothetical protein
MVKFDLDYFEYKWLDKPDAIIGIELMHTDVGKRNVSMTGLDDVERASRKVLAHINSIDSSIVEKIKIEIVIITKAKEVES